MKKKIAVVIFTLICTIGITASIASFSLGLNGRLTADGDSTKGNNLEEIYNSYLSQVQRIIKMSNMSAAEGTDVDPYYHIVQIVDSENATDASSHKISEYLKEFIDNDNDKDTSAGIFRTEVIDKGEKIKMKNKMIDLKTFEASDSGLALAIGKADLVYIACNTAYTSGNDLQGAAFNTDALAALEKYALAQSKPVLLDNEIVGIGDRTPTHSDTEATDAAKYFWNTVKSSMDTGTSKGVYSSKEESQTWTSFFNTDELYIAFDNRGNFAWNKFDYAGAKGDPYKHTVLEVVLDKDDLTGVTTPFESSLATEFKNAFVYSNTVKFDDYNPDTNEATNLKYAAVTITDFNAMSAEQIQAYDFIYFSHASSDEVLTVGGTDMAKSAISALEDMFYISVEGDEDTRLKRIIVDDNFYKVYSAPVADSGNTGSSGGAVDKNTSIYQFALELINIKDGKAERKKRNVELITNGFFKDMTAEKSKQVTDLINRSTYRTFSADNSKYKVLEIQPYFEVENSKWYADGTKREELTQNLNGADDQEISKALDTAYYNKDMSAARIAAATGLNVNQLEVTQVSANSLSSTAPNLLEDYDLIYFGSNNKNVKPTSQWGAHNLLTNKQNTVSWHPLDYADNLGGSEQSGTNKHNEYLYPMYTHTGDIIHQEDQFYFLGNDIGGQFYTNGSYTRLNGNDLTAKVYLKVYDYIAHGMPVIFEKDLIDTNYLIGGASVNADMVADSNNTISVNGIDTTLPRYVMSKKLDKSALVSELRSGKTGTYYETVYTKNTTTAREESTIDPSSYVYQLLWNLAENKGSEIYHAKNVFVGFDSNDVCKSTDFNNDNTYEKGTTKDDQYNVTIGKNKGAAEKLVASDLVKNITAYSIEAKKVLGKLNIGKSGAGIQLRHFLNNNMNVKPEFLFFDTNLTDYDSTRDLKKETRVENSRSPVFGMSVSGDSKHTFNVRLYYDFDGDGKFTYDSKGDPIEGRLEGSTYTSECVYENDAYKPGSDLTIDESKGNEYFVIDPDFVGVMPWKLVVTDKATGRAITQTGYPKFYPEVEGKNKQHIRLLEIIPGQANSGIGASGMKGTGNPGITTLCSRENTIHGSSTATLAGPCMDADGTVTHKFGLMDTKGSVDWADSLRDEYEIELDIMTVGQFSEAANAYLEAYCQNFDAWSAEDVKADNGFEQGDADEFKNKFMAKYFDGKSLKSTWTAMTKIEGNTTYYDFSKYGITNAFMRTWLMYGTDDTRTITLASKSYKNTVQKFKGSAYDMIIMGFARTMGGDVVTADGVTCDINNIGCAFLNAYLEKNGRMLLGTDTTSYVGFKTTTTQYWSRNINQYLRAAFGMDRFKFTTNGKRALASNGETSQPQNAYSQVNSAFLDGAGSFIYIPYSTANAKNTNGQTYPGEFFTVNSFDGTYERPRAADGTNMVSGGGGTDVLVYVKSKGTSTIFQDATIVAGTAQQSEINPSSNVVQNNTGLITNYPYTLDTNGTMKISRTNAQSFALDTEDEDMQIWYTLAGDTANDTSLYAADPMNGRSFYYIYTYRSVTYTGAGYDAICEDSDNDQERQLIINAILCKSKIHRSGPRVIFSKYSGSTKSDSEFMPASSTTGIARLECSGNDASDCIFDFKVTGGDDVSLKNVYMFLNYVDATGKEATEKVKFYDSTDELIPEGNDKYWTEDDPVVVNKAKSFDGSDSHWKEQIKKLMNTGEPFTITVYAEDSKGRYTSSDIQILPKTTLFDLN